MRLLVFVIVIFSTRIGSCQTPEFNGDAAKHITQTRFKCPITELTFEVPKLNAKTLQVRHRESVPGITWDLMFAEELGHMSTVTYTKIRKEYPKSDAVIQRTASRIKLEVLRQGGYLEWCGFLSENEGRVFQCVIRFPGGGQAALVRNKWLDRMDNVRLDVYVLRHYLVRDGWFVEFNQYVPQLLHDGTFDEDEYIDKWQKTLHDFVSGSSLVGSKGRYKQQIKDFKRPETYFRFEFADPSRD